MYTEEENVIEYLASILSFYSFVLLLDYSQIMLQGAIRGIGYQNAGTIISLISFWVVMLPV